MSSVAYQGLEPWLVEPRACRLKLAGCKPYFAQSLKGAEKPEENRIDGETKTTINVDQGDNNSDNETNIKQSSPNEDLGGWSFIQALTNTSLTPKIAEGKESLYVHPLAKRSSSKLSFKSLELCTENLGSETGIDTGEYSSISSSSSDSKEGGKSPTRERLESRQFLGNRRGNCRKFPPPLTSISGSNCVHVRPHREGGRLVIKAVTIPSPQTYFQAERGDGRLRLHFLKKCSPRFDSEAAEEEKDETQEEEEEKNGTHEEEEEKKETHEEEEEKNRTHEEEEEEEEEEEVAEEEEEEENECGDYWGEELRGNNGNEKEFGNFQRRSRCKEGGRGSKQLLIQIREPYCVATS